MKRSTLLWWDELGRFLGSAGETPPDSVSETLRQQIYRDLRVDGSALLSKSVASFLIAGLLVVSVCPQLGVGPFFAGSRAAESLAHVFHAGGPLLCAALCGAIFVGLGTLLTVLALRRSELRWVYRRRARVAAILAVAGLVVLAVIGNGDETTGGERFFWLLGAMAAAALVLESLGRARLPSAARYTAVPH